MDKTAKIAVSFNIISGCKYSTKMAVDCLTNHCIDEHQWGEFPCTFENCLFESYSQRCFKLHQLSHFYEQKENLLPITCDRANCVKVIICLGPTI